MEDLRSQKENIDLELRSFGVNPPTGPFFPPPAEMQRQHALSLCSQPDLMRDRTQTIDSYAGDLAELPVYTSNASRSTTWNLRVRTHSETEVLKKEDKVIDVLKKYLLIFLFKYQDHNLLVYCRTSAAL